MNKIIWKPYWDYRKEEKWLNEMCRNGWALKKYTWCRYEFEPCEEGEFIYRLELLEKSAQTAESQEYIRFLEDTGVEYITSYMRWIYCRKKAEEGNFEIYTDVESKIAHCKRLLYFWGALSAMTMLTGSSNLIMGLSFGTAIDNYGYININSIVGSLNLIIGLLLLFNLILPVLRQISELNKEKSIIE